MTAKPSYEIKNLINNGKKFQKTKNNLLLYVETEKIDDTITKKISSKVANKIRRFILNDDCNDTACALKVFRKTDYLKIEYFKNMHRFLPALFKMNGGKF